MSNPKRKVTDLLPSEAILISSDADLKVLDEFEKVGAKWAAGHLPTNWNPTKIGYGFPFYLFGSNYCLVWAESTDRHKLPAADFIPTESDEVEVSDTVLLSEVRNKLNPIKNLIAMLENGLVKGSVEMHDLVLKEIEQCKINIEELTRNTPKQNERNRTYRILLRGIPEDNLSI